MLKYYTRSAHRPNQLDVRMMVTMILMNPFPGSEWIASAMTELETR